MGAVGLAGNGDGNIDIDFYIFFQIPALSLAISAAVILIMSGFILYDTSAIIRDEQTNYILATVGMYLSIFNIFIHLLNLLGALSRD